MKYVKPERIVLKGNPQFTEAWVQDRIAEDPSILGLGDLFPEGKDAKGRSYEDYRWSRLKHFAPADMYAVIGERSPCLRHSAS